VTDQEKQTDRCMQIRSNIIDLMASYKDVTTQEVVAVLCTTMVEVCMVCKIKKPLILSRVSETYELIDQQLTGQKQ